VLCAQRSMLGCLTVQASTTRLTQDRLTIMSLPLPDAAACAPSCASCATALSSCPKADGPEPALSRGGTPPPPDARARAARFPAAIRLTSVLGATVNDTVPAAAFTNANHTGAYGHAQFPLNATLSEVGALRGASLQGALA